MWLLEYERQRTILGHNGRGTTASEHAQLRKQPSSHYAHLSRTRLPIICVPVNLYRHLRFGFGVVVVAAAVVVVSSVADTGVVTEIL